MEQNTKNGGIGLPFLLFVIFTILKLTDNIDWSWWWVTSPIWLPFLLGLTAVVVISFFLIIHNMLKNKP